MDETTDKQKVWVDREMVAMVQFNVMKLVDFLNDFDSSARSKLSALNGKLTKIELSLRHLDLMCTKLEER